jgi:hypothetical protein
MSHLLSQKDGKYKVWTTVSDGYLTDKWLTEAELRSWMVKQAEREYKKKVIEKLWLFPYGWMTKDREVLMTDTAVRKAHHEWVMTLCDCKTEEDYDLLLDAKFLELTQGLPDFYSF